MKKILFIGLVCLASCKEEVKIEPQQKDSIDSLIELSQKNSEQAVDLSKKGDSTITNKVDKTVQKIGKLENEIKELKQENNELKEKLDDANDDGNTYRIRAISDN